ncbi:hypothetical protein HanXRQr2_Chr04g0190861 [Helianthus annuus]|uniref:Uncharacterized protein n=1 Tax=Helianthus annuus TaxID=4232 RepID=A0A251V2T1_HELAN|nr:hypothetical protein HanXRQr2_Chr04g0190861 [Helianthus annuus]
MKGLDPVTSYVGNPSTTSKELYSEACVCVKEFDTDDIDETGYYCSCFVPEQLRRFAIDIDEQTD